ncbi:hypothetical protein J3R83DRAFT_275 [Lanmaoa asiatica]|nr:hypothetical protein J3R83DRAFT_275 [Lanmaoa asiatica]
MVLSVVDQVSEFKEYLASNPVGAEWNCMNSLFAFWIGINGLRSSVDWAYTTESTSKADDLYIAGAHDFLFLTVPPINHAPYYLEEGPQAATQMGTDITNYNNQLTQSVHNFQENHTDLGSVTVFGDQAQEIIRSTTDTV